ncbi:sigma-70 family RNA polymerase sigma factor [Falsiroseomonas sp. E2-1-a20]|uniref:sigma-70 family RNA polymerase sigma factor n=1 Tax=Falsiroseomonas sp. E2-1-a20 TaxID=3239300 RepID=UPI003F2EF496
MRQKSSGWIGFDVVAQLGALRRYARSLTRDEVAAEDLVHDALIRAYENRAGFRPGADLRPWLLAILHNGFVGGWRSRQAERRRLEEVATLAPSQNPGLGPEAAVRLGQLHRAFAALPDEQRAALHLVAVEGVPYGEAATILDIPLGTLMSRLGRARATLRAIEAEEPAAPGTTTAGSGGPPAWRPRLRIVGGSHDDA